MTADTYLILDASVQNNITISAKQYDSNLRFIDAEIVNLGETITVPQDAVVTINSRRSDGESAAYVGSVNEDGTIRVPVPYWLLSVAGEADCDISIYLNGRLTTLNFEINVVASVTEPSEVVTPEDVDVVTDMINRTSEAVARAEEAATGVEDAVSKAKTAAENANSASSEASQAASNANTATMDARSAAMGARTAANQANSASSAASAAAEAANSAASSAESAKEAAVSAAEAASEAAQSANIAAGGATEAAQNANAEATSAGSAATVASQAASRAESAISEVSDAVSRATSAAESAESAKSECETATESCREATEAAQAYADDVSHLWEQERWIIQGNTGFNSKCLYKYQTSLLGGSGYVMAVQLYGQGSPYLYLRNLRNASYIQLLFTDIKAVLDDAGIANSLSTVSGKNALTFEFSQADVGKSLVFDLSDSSFKVTNLAVTDTQLILFTRPTVNTVFGKFIDFAHQGVQSSAITIPT